MHNLTLGIYYKSKGNNKPCPNNMTYELKADNKVVGTFETAQDAMDYGNAYHKDGYTVSSK